MTLCMMNWAFFNINRHDYCCDGQKCIEAKVKHASHCGTRVFMCAQRSAVDYREERNKTKEDWCWSKCCIKRIMFKFTVLHVTAVNEITTFFEIQTTTNKTFVRNWSLAWDQTSFITI